jgi:hypothetical protein
MFKTKNDLSEAIRTKAVELLNARLADAIDLQTQTKQAHGNGGPAGWESNGTWRDRVTFQIGGTFG